MARLNPTEMGNLERRIQELKNGIAGISEERWRAALSRDESAVVKARIKASEKTLENWDAIANYLSFFSPPLSKEIQTKGKNAKDSLEKIKHTANAQEIHDWIKTELIPSTKMSERLAHLAISSMKKAQGQDLEFFKWSPSSRLR
jgi:uncharacterized coiled-coil DUF342 family protein